MLTVLLGRTPAPRAWDNLFSERPSGYLRVRLDSGAWLAGRFADASYAGGFPYDPDLYLEEGWEIDAVTGDLGEAGTGSPIYIPTTAIKWIEVIPVAGSEEDSGA